MDGTCDPNIDMYTNPEGKCFNTRLGTFHAYRGGPMLRRGTIVSLMEDDTVFQSVSFNIRSRMHGFCVWRAVNGKPRDILVNTFNVPLVEARSDDPEPIVAIRNALRNRLVIEFAARSNSQSLQLNQWFQPHANIRGPVAALLVEGYSL